MAEMPGWRKLLGQIIENPHERQRLADELGVNAITLTRWANNTSNPRSQSIQKLLAALPKPERERMASLINQEDSDLTSFLEKGPPENFAKVIPAEFYARVIEIFGKTTHTQRFLTLGKTILQQALGQLTPRGGGIAITIVRCMPPSDGQKVRSLHERLGRGTHPWQPILEERAIFLGSESMAGYTVTERRELIHQDREQRTIYPVHWVKWEESAAAYPIMVADKVAGSFLVSCSLKDYFTPERCILIESYAKLTALAFNEADFYRADQIDLRPMPSYDLQEERQAGLRQRISRYLAEASSRGERVDHARAQEFVLRQVEEEFLQLPPYQPMYVKSVVSSSQEK